MAAARSLEELEVIGPGIDARPDVHLAVHVRLRCRGRGRGGSHVVFGGDDLDEVRFVDYVVLGDVGPSMRAVLETREELRHQIDVGLGETGQVEGIDLLYVVERDEVREVEPPDELAVETRSGEIGGGPLAPGHLALESRARRFCDLPRAE